MSITTCVPLDLFNIHAWLLFHLLNIHSCIPSSALSTIATVSSHNHVGQVSDNVVNVTSDVVIDGNVDVSAIQSLFNSEPVLNESVQVDAEQREGLASYTGLMSYDGVCSENVETDRPVRVDNNVMSTNMSYDNADQRDMFLSSSGVHINSEPDQHEVHLSSFEVDDVPVDHGGVSDQHEVPLGSSKVVDVPVTDSISLETDMGEALREAAISS
ncbi:hypothetical protein V6N13_140543 [Hibiscus sabdariffa]